MFLKYSIVMMQIFLLKLFFYQIITTQMPPIISSEKTWTYEVLDYQVIIDDRSFVDSEINITRISRGNYGLSGYLDLKVDLHENTTGEGFLERSRDTLNGPFYRTPYMVPKVSLTQGLNTFYKDLMMESLHECSNAPYFDKFVPPLKKYKMVFNNCRYKIDPGPSHMEEGFYKIHVIVHGPTTVKHIVLVEIINLK